jgi:hypothetical protein
LSFLHAFVILEKYPDKEKEIELRTIYFSSGPWVKMSMNKPKRK